MVWKVIGSYPSSIVKVSPCVPLMVCSLTPDGCSVRIYLLLSDWMRKTNIRPVSYRLWYTINYCILYVNGKHSSRWVRCPTWQEWSASMNVNAMKHVRSMEVSGRCRVTKDIRLWGHMLGRSLLIITVHRWTVHFVIDQYRPQSILRANDTPLFVTLSAHYQRNPALDCFFIGLIWSTLISRWNVTGGYEGMESSTQQSGCIIYRRLDEL